MANRAAWELTAAGEPAVALLKTKLAACSVSRHNLIKRLVAELDDEDFKTREHATKELASQIDEARALLQETRDRKPNAEVRRRVDELLTGDIDGVPSESTRSLRALAVLERLGTAEAKALLTKLAAGAPDAVLTQQARAALQRLERRGMKEQQ